MLKLLSFVIGSLLRETHLESLRSLLIWVEMALAMSCRNESSAVPWVSLSLLGPRTLFPEAERNEGPFT